MTTETTEVYAGVSVAIGFGPVVLMSGRVVVGRAVKN